MRKILLLLVILSSLFALVGVSYVEGVISQSPGEETPPQISAEKPRLKLTTVTDSIFNTYQNEGLGSALTLAEGFRLITTGDRVQLVIEGENASSADAIGEKVGDVGGVVEATWENLVQAQVPVSEITRMVELSEVKLVREPYRWGIHSEVVSEGVKNINSTVWKYLSFRPPAQPVKVAVLDLEFFGYDHLLGSELPLAVTPRTFRADNQISVGKGHGTACAEIVHDVAPDAELYLVNYDTDVEHHLAVDYLIEEKVDIVSYSISWANMGAGDGTGPICEDVDRASANGIIWVAAAGNDAERHWEGAFSDPEGNGWHNFTATDETLSVHLEYAGYPLEIYLNWDDWYDSDQDYDLYLTNDDGEIVAFSRNNQTGTQWPTEAIFCYTPPTSGWYHIWVKKHNATRNVKLELVIRGAWVSIEYSVPEGSISIPADSENSIAVGATGWWWGDPLSSFSSWGPTTDGRIKPDFTAPSGVSTATFGEGIFSGTSAATPHVAGAFALIKSKIGIFSWDDIFNLLAERAIDYGEPGKDIKYGYGRLNLGPPEK